MSSWQPRQPRSSFCPMVYLVFAIELLARQPDSSAPRKSHAKPILDLESRHSAPQIAFPIQPASLWFKKRPIWCKFASARAAQGRASQGWWSQICFPQDYWRSMPWLDLWTGGVESTSLWNGRNIFSSASQLRMPSSPSLPWYVVNRALIWPNTCVSRLLSSLYCSGIIASEFQSIRCGIWRWSGPWRFLIAWKDYFGHFWLTVPTC